MDLDEAASEHNASQQFERLVFFSDAVFAIAITVLVLDMKLLSGKDIVLDLNAMIPKFVGFGVSFFVIDIYWIAHHRLFGTLKREDGKLRVVNLAFLASVVFLPFSTSALAERPSVSASVILYALAVASVGVLLILLTFAARRPGLMRPKETRGGTLPLSSGRLEPRRSFCFPRLSQCGSPGGRRCPGLRSGPPSRVREGRTTSSAQCRWQTSTCSTQATRLASTSS